MRTHTPAAPVRCRAAAGARRRTFMAGGRWLCARTHSTTHERRGQAARAGGEQRAWKQQQRAAGDRGLRRAGVCGDGGGGGETGGEMSALNSGRAPAEQRRRRRRERRRNRIRSEGVGEDEGARCLRRRRRVGAMAMAMAMRGAKCRVHQTAATGEMRCRRCGKQWRRCANNKLQVHARNEMSKALHCNGKAMGSLSPHLTWHPDSWAVL